MIAISTVKARVTKNTLTEYAQTFPVKTDKIITRWKKEGATETQNYMRTIANYKTGFLRASITTTETEKGFSVTPTAPYAGYVNMGFKPHMIFPVHAKFLRWIGMDGQPHYAKKVMHPGYIGSRFVQRTKEDMAKVLKQLLQIITVEET